MKTVRLNWILPSTRTNGSALPIDKIAKSLIAMSADNGANFSELGEVPAPDTAFEQTELEDGAYIFRQTTVGTNGKASDPIFVSVTVSSVPEVPDDETFAPSPATGFTATVV